MNSQRIQIRGEGFCYDAHVGRGLIEQTGRLTRAVVASERAAIITDSNIPATLIDRVRRSLAGSDFRVTTVVAPAGENSKSLGEVERICGEMSSLDRSSVVVGLGGGVVGDLAGFVASVFHRGIPHVQIPTTLLAMVDSAIGGKNGVNLPVGKNLIGTFHQPALVIADLDTLSSLPEEAMRQGWAEIVKHAIIRDAEMFELLRASSPGLVATEALIARNIRIKAAVVAADPRDASGERAILNFGHTVGHGIERASGFRLSHGECVSLGMVAACEISEKRAGLSVSERDEVVALLEKLGLPTKLPSGLANEEIMDAIRRDKKFLGEVRFVVIPRIGEANLSREVSTDDIDEALTHLQRRATTAG